MHLNIEIFSVEVPLNHVRQRQNKSVKRKSFEEKNILSGKVSKFWSEMTCTPSTYRKLQRKFGQQKGARSERRNESTEM